MFDELLKDLMWIIGGGEVDPIFSLWQLSIRTALVYIVALMLIRIGKRRFMGSYTAFDILLGFVVGSIMSRTITGAIRFIDMVVAVSILIAMHWIISTLSFYFENFSGVVKTNSRKLIIDGEIQKDAMQKSKLGENDLLQSIRQKGNVEKFEDVKTAYLERDGSITVIPMACEPKVLDIEIKDGIQKVRVSLES